MYETVKVTGGFCGSADVTQSCRLQTVSSESQQSLPYGGLCLLIYKARKPPL
jgi:hypothetical protein